MRRSLRTGFVLAGVVLAMCTALQPRPSKARPLEEDWRVYGGTSAGDRYSELHQITVRTSDSL